VTCDTWAVEFACNEAVIREGSYQEVNYPDDLGCPVLCIHPLAAVRLKAAPWVKDGELRCELIPHKYSGVNAGGAQTGVPV
jgi:hypothetical protein